MDLQNSIIVFDESHNIENASEAACSFEITTECLEYTKMMKGLKDKVSVFIK